MTQHTGTECSNLVVRNAGATPSRVLTFRYEGAVPTVRILRTNDRVTDLVAATFVRWGTWGAVLLSEAAQAGESVDVFGESVRDLAFVTESAPMSVRFPRSVNR
ncbi:MAG: hypothetical protein SGJ11_11880 [Phycisphaerae bacterium]|nr:hypothetical protein [Phycisphaerae bacterium]